MSGNLLSINFGDHAQYIAIEKYKGSERYSDVIALPTKRVDTVYTHYVQGIGHFYCLTAKAMIESMGKGESPVISPRVCCKDHESAKIRYVLPIIQYTGDVEKGYGMPIFIKHLFLSERPYNDLKRKDKLKGGNLHKFDILVTCEDQEYQTLKFDIIDEGAKFLKDKKMQAIIKAGLKAYDELIESSIARTIDEQKYLEESTKLGHTSVGLLEASDDPASFDPDSLSKQLEAGDPEPAPDEPDGEEGDIVDDVDFEDMFEK